MEAFGERIKKIRIEKGIPLRTVAAYLDIDQAILSKIERGKRNANRNLVLKIAEYFNINQEELIITWLSDKLIYELGDEDDIALKVLHLAEERIAYKSFKKIDRNNLVLQIRKVINNFNAIKKAWIFGSFSREDDNFKSDIDIAIETEKTFSYFDLAELKLELEQIANRKVDIGFIDSFKPNIYKNMEPDLKLIYEK